MKFPAYVLTLFFLLNVGTVAAQSTFTLSADFRPRLEQRYGYRTLPPDTASTAFFVSQRLRLNALFQHERIALYLSLQDVRTWGDEEHLRDIPSTSIHEGWGEIFVTKAFSIQFGRMELVYDDHRLLGNVDWVQNARSHDALLLKLKNETFALHAGGAFNQTGEPLFETDYFLNNYKALAFLWLQKKFMEQKESLSFIALMDGYNSQDSTAPKMKLRFTIGPHYTLALPKAFLQATFYFQTGKNVFDQTILAYLASAYGEYRLEKFSAGAGVDYISGNSDDVAADRTHSFATLYATNHKFYGHMDYFLDIPADTRGKGLIDFYVKLLGKISSKVSIGTDLHYFMLAHQFQNMPLPLGFEADLFANYKPLDFLSIQLGTSIMAATETLEAVKGPGRKQFGEWAFVMVRLNPVLLKVENN